MWIKLDELTRTQLIQSGSTSNLTAKHLDNRYANGFSDIKLANANFSTKEDYVECNFLVTSTNNNKKGYTCTLRFYDVNKSLNLLYHKPWDQLSHTEEERFIKYIFENNDLRVYSSDPSFQFQGHWESLSKKDLTIYKYTGPKGKDIWKNRHNDSGGLSNSDIYLTKHLSQILENLLSYVRDCAKVLTVS